MLIIILLILISCHGPPEDHSPSSPLKSENPIVAQYQGNLSSSEYDSIVNELTMFQNETFDLHQVDRIAEHHLNEKDLRGIYAWLADSTQLALYTEDGILMLRFLLRNDGLIPMSVSGDRITDATYIWRKKSHTKQ